MDGQTTSAVCDTIVNRFAKRYHFHVKIMSSCHSAGSAFCAYFLEPCNLR